MRQQYKRWSSKAAQVLLIPVRDRLVVASFPTDIAIQPAYYYFPLPSFPIECTSPNSPYDAAKWQEWENAVRPNRDKWRADRDNVWAIALERFDDVCDSFRKDKRYTSRQRRALARIRQLASVRTQAEEVLANDRLNSSPDLRDYYTRALTNNQADLERAQAEYHAATLARSV